MAAEDLLVHDGGDGQTVKTVGEGLPQFDVVPPFAWISITAASSRQQCRLIDKILQLNLSASNDNNKVVQLTLIIESVDPIDRSAFVVSS